MNAKTLTERRRNYFRVAKRFWPGAYDVKLTPEGADPCRASWAVREGCPPETIRLFEERAKAEQCCGDKNPKANCGCDSVCNPYLHKLWDLSQRPPQRVEVSVESEDANAV
jgi:hypothetical protein